MSSKSQFQAHNHFVPRLYLKRFACSPGIIYHYPLLVSHDSVHQWSRRPISGVAAQRHLYTVVEPAEQSDEIERWFAKEFDDPAEEAIERAVTEATLTRKHWRCLARFFGAQHTRTTANYLNSLQRWKTEMPTFMEETMKEVKSGLELAKQQGHAIGAVRLTETNKLFPMRTKVEPLADSDSSTVSVEIRAGRKLWLWGIQHALRPNGLLR